MSRSINNDKKKLALSICESILIITLLLVFIYMKNYVHLSKDNLDIDISVLSYQDNHVELLVKANRNNTKCAYSLEKDADTSKLDFKNTTDNACFIEGKLANYYVYFKDFFGNLSDGVLVSNYLLKNDFKDNYYLAIGGEESIKDNVLFFGDKEISYELLNNDVVSIEDDKIVGLKNGFTTLKITIGDSVYKESNIYVTDGITVMPKSFDTKKPFLACNQYDTEKALLMDKILFDRVEAAGYGTRAGVVAAGRFLTLEFPYKLKYFYENGRVHESGVNFVDGEGRYYHRGLYLDSSKFESLLASSVAGPVTWGCKLTNYEDDPPLFVRYNKYPNGLDCSGFVSWVLLNGGFDVGDIGAGESSYPHQLTDTGDFMNLTQDLIDNNVIKVGDLLNVPGHIAVIIGIDDQNYYVAESLNTFDGLVMKTYNRKTIKRTFPYVVLMDKVYLEDGNLTNMWY